MGNSHSSGTDRYDASPRDLRNFISATATNHPAIVAILGGVILAGLVLYLYLERRKTIAHQRRNSITVIGKDQIESNPSNLETCLR